MKDIILVFYVLPGNPIYWLFKPSLSYQRACYVIFLAMSSGRTMSLFVAFLVTRRSLSHEEKHW